MNRAQRELFDMDGIPAAAVIRNVSSDFITLCFLLCFLNSGCSKKNWQVSLDTIWRFSCLLWIHCFPEWWGFLSTAVALPCAVWWTVLGPQPQGSEFLATLWSSEKAIINLIQTFSQTATIQSLMAFFDDRELMKNGMHASKLGWTVPKGS